MSTISKKKAIVGSLAGLVLVSGTALGGIAIANANSSNTPSSGITQGEQDDQNETAVKGSISVPESATEMSDAEESAQLAKLATVDATAAEAAATASVPGSTAIKTDLNDEDGFLVYDVDVKDGAGTVTEVTVDAGDGTVLAAEAGDGEGDDGQGTDEADQADEAGAQDDNGADGEINDAEEAAQDAANGE